MLKESVFICFLALGVFLNHPACAQQVPAAEENIPFLVTFGPEALKSYGDDDFSQTFFFKVPKTQITPVFFRVFDPDIGGLHDEPIGGFDTKTSFEVYGGTGAYTHEDARGVEPLGNFNSGTLLASATFGQDPAHDNQWFTFGPFNPREGEWVEEIGGYIFKLVAQGKQGNDGNLYRYFMSVSGQQNKEVEGGNAFTFEYTFRLHDNIEEVSHIYPYVDEGVISIRQHNFDYDQDGVIRVVSYTKNGHGMEVSLEGDWSTSTHAISKDEQYTSLDIQFIKSKTRQIKNNNIVFYLTNQYGEFLPFYTVPIGGIPKFQYKVNIRKKSR